MKTITTKTDVYKFNELSDEAKDKAVELLYDINVDSDWWNSVYEDAKQAGLEITEFDLDRNRHAKGKFLASAEETAHKIESEHGEACETHKTAIAYLADRDKIVETAEKDETDELVDDLNELDAEFLTNIMEDYSITLQNEFDYLMSREAIIEIIEANDYDFTIEGKLF